MNLNAESFRQLLAWLGRYRSPPEEKYEELRKKLIKFFACNRRPDAEDLADCVIDRVAQKVPEIAEGYKGDPAPYFLRVARYILLEQSRRPVQAVASSDFVDPADPRNPGPSSGGDKEECLQRCMKRLPSRGRELILAYYRELGPLKKSIRRTLARKEGIGMNALRIRVHRVRQKLVECWRACLDLRRVGLEGETQLRTEVRNRE